MTAHVAHGGVAHHGVEVRVEGGACTGGLRLGVGRGALLERLTHLRAASEGLGRVGEGHGRRVAGLGALAGAIWATHEANVRDVDFRLGLDVRQIEAVQVLGTEHAEQVVHDGSRELHVGVTLDDALRLEASERELVDEGLQRNAVLQANGHAHGKAVHERAERCAFFVHVDEDLTERAVFVLAGAQEDLVTANAGLLGETNALLGKANAQTLGAALVDGQLELRGLLRLHGLGDR